MKTFTMNEATEAIRIYLTSRGRADNSIRGYVADTKMFFLEMELSEVSLQDLEYKAALWLNRFRKQIAAKTTSRRLTTMRTLGKCFGLEVLSEYSAPTAMKTAPHPLPNGKDDLIAMLRLANNDEQRALIVLLGMCGLRVSEARSIGPKDFNLHDMTIKLRGKGDKDRYVPVSKAAWNVLCAFVVKCTLDNQELLVNLSDRTAREIVTNLAARAGIKRRISSHDLRATWGTEANRHTKNLRAVQEALGHADPRQTALYTDTNIKDMHEAAKFMDDDEYDL